MRKTIRLLVFAAVMSALVLAVGTSVYALEPEGNLTDGISYTFDEENGYLEITGTGELPNYCFSGKTEIKTVSIGEGITKVGERAFQYCYGLETVTLPDSVEEIGECAFYECSDLASINMPGSLKVIQRDAFYECRNLTSVELPEGLEYIGSYAFYYCSMKSLVIPDSIIEMGESVFNNCGELKSLKLPENLKVIPNYIFGNCGKLKAIEIPSCVEEIGSSAFAMCTDLKTVTIPASVKRMEGCFAGCFSLEEVIFKGDFPSPMNQSFMMCTLTAYYPLDNETWTEEVLDTGYGGKVKWVGYCTDHTPGEAVQENVVEATVFKAGSYDEVVYCSRCGNELSRTTVSVNKLTPTIKLSPTKKTLKKGKSFTLKVTGLAKGDSVKSFKSSKTGIATVTKKGKITAKKKGKTVITVTLKSGKTAKCTVTVN